MDSDDNKQSDQFDASLPLPIDSRGKTSKQPAADNAAADLIRKKVDAAYEQEPSASSESKDLKKLGDSIERSKHQQFIYELTSSGKPLHEIQTAWHEYYAGLSDAEKHEIWREFYNSHAQASQYSGSVPPLMPQQKSQTASQMAAARQLSRPATGGISRSLYGVRHRSKDPSPASGPGSAQNPLRSILFGFGVGVIVVLIFLFSFFNERFIAPFIQPSRTVSATPIINGSAVIGPEAEIIIPKINVQIPVVYGVGTIDEGAIDKALESGVVHYADTALPGQNGNVVVVGHSSNNIFNPGRYKFAFVLLSKLENGDTFYLQKDGKRYTYQVYKKQVVSPSEVSVLGPAERPASATLITCDPPGTSTNRLVVVGEQIDPSPIGNVAQAAETNIAAQSSQLPGNAPSLWSRILKWLTY